MHLEVKCSVNNCHYWAEGNECHAEQIVVTSNHVGGANPSRYDTGTITSSLKTPTNNSIETCCKTFVKANSSDAAPSYLPGY